MTRTGGRVYCDGMRLRFVPSLALLCTFPLAACGGDEPGTGGGSAREDGGLQQTDETVTLADGGDLGVIVLTCDGVADGTSCGAMGGLICLDGECATSVCGDGYADARRGEQCDDGNATAEDGCEPSCTFMCSEIDECDDGNACNGNEVCDTAEHLCVGGMTAPDETPCSSAAVAEGECRAGTCVPKGCGNGEVEGDEECDDGNAISGDGCEPTCTYSCREDADCNDDDVCNGVETCDVARHACVEGTPLDCKAEDECHVATCDPARGCSMALIDADGDRYAPATLPCGTDCDDTRADVNPGQVELCDDIDQDCDGDPQPKETPTWYVDCDADGYADRRAESRKQCAEPAPAACGGRWTTRAPTANQDPSAIDCFDGDNRVRPDQTGWFTKPSDRGYDYDCSGADEQRYVKAKVSPSAVCITLQLGSCTGTAGWVGDTPACGARAEYTECQGGLLEVDKDEHASVPQSCGIRGCTCSRVTYQRTQECR